MPPCTVPKRRVAPRRHAKQKILERTVRWVPNALMVNVLKDFAWESLTEDHVRNGGCALREVAREENAHGDVLDLVAGVDTCAPVTVARSKLSNFFSNEQSDIKILQGKMHKVE